jgi:hypothetical protein
LHWQKPFFSRRNSPRPSTDLNNQQAVRLSCAPSASVPSSYCVRIIILYIIIIIGRRFRPRTPQLPMPVGTHNGIAQRRWACYLKNRELHSLTLAFSFLHHLCFAKLHHPYSIASEAHAP